MHIRSSNTVSFGIRSPSNKGKQIYQQCFALIWNGVHFISSNGLPHDRRAWHVPIQTASSPLIVISIGLRHLFQWAGGFNYSKVESEWQFMSSRWGIGHLWSHSSIKLLLHDKNANREYKRHIIFVTRDHHEYLNSDSKWFPGLDTWTKGTLWPYCSCSLNKKRNQSIVHCLICGKPQNTLEFSKEIVSKSRQYP